MRRNESQSPGASKELPMLTQRVTAPPVYRPQKPIQANLSSA
jgi:hypothetical protein